MDALHDLIAASEDWLMQRVLEYAAERGYTAYTSTLVEAWRASVAGISRSIMAALKSSEPVRPVRADADFASDPVASFGVREAKKHRERGVTHTLFLGLMKYYRQAYVDLLMQSPFPPPEALRYRECLDNFFDRMELGFSAEWLKIQQVELIGELQQANLLITNEKNKFLTIFESLPNPVLFISREGRVADMNRAAASLFYGMEGADSHYYSGADFPVPPSLEEDVRAFATADPTPPRIGSEIRIEAGGSYIVIMQRMLDVSGKFNGTVVILNDISNLKSLEEEIELLNTDLAERAFQLEQANQELETFNYSVSHDLRSPLTGISGYCQLLLGLCGEQLDDQCKDYVNEIMKTCLRMNQLISTMLDFSRLAKCEMARERVDLSLIAQHVAGTLRFENPDRRVEFQIQPDVIVDGDPRLLRIVMENLLGNALKFTAKRETGRIEFGACTSAEGSVYFVRDNGVGFSMTAASRLFSPFQRLHDTADYGGFGVGLATVERVISRHGGRVWAEGEVEKGATVYFTLNGG